MVRDKNGRFVKGYDARGEKNGFYGKKHTEVKINSAIFFF